MPSICDQCDASSFLTRIRRGMEIPSDEKHLHEFAKGTFHRFITNNQHSVCMSRCTTPCGDRVGISLFSKKYLVDMLGDVTTKVGLKGVVMSPPCPQRRWATSDWNCTYEFHETSVSSFKQQDCFILWCPPTIIRHRIQKQNDLIEMEEEFL